MPDLEDIVSHHDGLVRRLGRTLPTQSALLMRSGMRTVRQVLEAAGIGLLPRDKWKSHSRMSYFGKPQWILNQGQHGSCVGYSAATATMRQRAIRGCDFQRLSGSYIYDQINGGRDNGACITDSKTVLETDGTCLESDYPEPLFRSGQRPATLGIAKLLDGLVCDSFDEMGTVLTLGGIVQLPIYVGRRFQNFTGDGVAGFDDGQGNHSVCGDDNVYINGLWYIAVPNTWGFEFGPFRNGYVLVSERHVQAAGCPEDAYGHLNSGGSGS